MCYKKSSKKKFVRNLIIISCFVVGTTSNIVNARTTNKYETIIVAKGDTLWDISKERTKNDIRKYIYNVEKINNLENAGDIYPGQEIILPVE